MMRERYYQLDVLRGVAALCVVVFHARPFFGNVLPGGYLAVDLFFVLSGFVIDHAYAGRLSAGMTARDFVRRRLIRLYPLYLLGLLAGICLALLLITFHSADAIAPSELVRLVGLGLIFLPAWFAADAFPLNVPAWSLFYELVVNAIYAFFFRHLTTMRIGVICAVSAVCLAVGVMIHGNADLGPAPSDLPFALARAIFGFSLGVLIRRTGARVAAVPLWPAIGVCVVMMALPATDGLRVLVDLAVVLFIFPALVAGLGANGTTPRAPRPLVALGDCSYALYAIHWPLLWMFRALSERVALDPVPAGALYVVLVVSAAWLADRYFDQPARHLMQGRRARSVSS